MHATAKWPAAVPVNLWPHEHWEANEAINSTPDQVTMKIPNSVFGNTATLPIIKGFHTFGCPVYVLDNQLAAGNAIPKWHKRSRVGLYLGRLPYHASTVALVLNIKSAIVSAQFHIKFDDLFETATQIKCSDISWHIEEHFTTKETAKSLVENILVMLILMNNFSQKLIKSINIMIITTAGMLMKCQNQYPYPLNG
jgi:hypothetical protein